MLAIRRMKSNNKKERWLGYQNLVFAALFLVSLTLTIFYHETELFHPRWRFAFVFLNLWLFICMLWTKDTQKENKYHKNTFDDFVQNFNFGLFASESSDTLKKHVSVVSVFLFGAMTVMSEMFISLFCLMRNDAGEGSNIIFCVMLFNVFLFLYGITYLTETMKKLPVSLNNLKAIHSVEDLSDEQKKYFIRQCERNVDEKGYVSQEDVWKIIIKIKESIEERAKDVEIEKKRLEYKKVFKL